MKNEHIDVKRQWLWIIACSFAVTVLGSKGLAAAFFPDRNKYKCFYGGWNAVKHAARKRTVWFVSSITSRFELEIHIFHNSSFCYCFSVSTFFVCVSAINAIRVGALSFFALLAYKHSWQISWHETMRRTYSVGKDVHLLLSFLYAFHFALRRFPSKFLFRHRQHGMVKVITDLQ